jgi:hypothetical protein
MGRRLSCLRSNDVRELAPSKERNKVISVRRHLQETRLGHVFVASLATASMWNVPRSPELDFEKPYIFCTNIMLLLLLLLLCRARSTDRINNHLANRILPKVNR